MWDKRRRIYHGLRRTIIKHLGWLSRIELTDEEIKSIQSQIKEIIGYMNKLDTIPLVEIEPEWSEKEFSELRRDHANPFKCDMLQLAQTIDKKMDL